MALIADELRQPPPSRPAGNIAATLKEWRAHKGVSQKEAAAQLGVSVRTLQGWEAGRPMPYPSLLRLPVDVTAAARDDSTSVPSAFARELATFIDFIGPAEIDKAVSKTRQKLDVLSPGVRQLHGDRFYFHEQWESLIAGSGAFGLDLCNLPAVRAATLIVAINRARDGLPQSGQDRLRSMVLENLQPARDVRRIEHTIRCYAHFVRNGCSTTFADRNGEESFDLVVETPSGSVEVECKSVTEDTGAPVKTDVTVDLSETFRSSVLKGLSVGETGIFVLKLRKPPEAYKHLGRKLRQALNEVRDQARAEEGAFSLKFLPKPEWRALFDAQRFDELSRSVAVDPLLAGNPHCVVRAGHLVLGLVVVPHKPTVMADRLARIFQKAARQCSGDRPALLWLHFFGVAEREFIALAQFAAAGRGAGLDAIVANALDPKGGATDRSHVERIRFSPIPDALPGPVGFGPMLSFGGSAPVDGPAYDVPNPFCRFPPNLDL